MRVKVIQEGDYNVVALIGRLDIEKNKLIKDTLLKNYSNKNIVFCMDQLQFIGSSGIQNFFQNLKEIQEQKKMNMRIVGLHHDFQRLLMFSSLQDFNVFENIESAIGSFAGEAAIVTVAPV